MALFFPCQRLFALPFKNHLLECNQFQSLAWLRCTYFPPRCTCGMGVPVKNWDINDDCVLVRQRLFDFKQIIEIFSHINCGFALYDSLNGTPS